ncbi:Histone deacetylase HDT1 [Abeliophyllum distichum]|uniref:Histone deacetylase HDT1 n=1 Tax=Abeliophyllum distichum TaxID=126358 RepID=A0ABD1RFN3_9LAMI
MEFWGAEVKSGEPLPVTPGEGMVLHLSQACLGELKKEKGNESICLFLKVDGKKLVLGTLFTEKLPQQQFDLVFDRDFELSHNWKNGSIYFYGYKASNPFEEEYPFICQQ